MRSRIGGAVALAATLAAVPAWAGGTTERVSVGAGGRASLRRTATPRQATVSADGRYVSSTSRRHRPRRATPTGTPTSSSATAHARHDRAGQRRDRGRPANGGGFGSFLAISADGRFVAFNSDATNLVPNGIQPRRRHVFVRDRQNGHERAGVSMGLGRRRGRRTAARDRRDLGRRALRRLQLATPPTSSRATPTVSGTSSSATARRHGRAGQRPSNGAQGNQDSGLRAIGDLGRRALRRLRVGATNLVPDDTNSGPGRVRPRPPDRPDRAGEPRTRAARRPTATATTRRSPATGATSPSISTPRTSSRATPTGARRLRPRPQDRDHRAGQRRAERHPGQRRQRRAARSRGTAATSPSTRPPRTSSRATQPGDRRLRPRPGRPGTTERVNLATARPMQANGPSSLRRDDLTRTAASWPSAPTPPTWCRTTPTA